MVGGVSSEESSGECACGKPRRPRESPRRKAGGGRSPTTHIRSILIQMLINLLFQ